jgi:hypothetical protein
MSQEYELPPARIRSAYEAYIDDGGTDEQLSIEALKQDMMQSLSNSTWKPGDIFRVVIKRWDDDGAPLRIQALKIGHMNYRFAGSIEELEHIAMLHGVYKK